MCLHMEGLRKRKTTPCNDSPAACGWANEIEVEVDGIVYQKHQLCAYPYCWWGGRYLERVVEQLRVDKGDERYLQPGQQFSAILYHGDNSEIALAIFSHMDAARFKPEPFNINNLGFVRILEVTTEFNDPTFRVSIRGELI